MLKVQTTWRIQVAAPELHHGFTTQGQPWRLGHGLGHILGNSRTCGGRRLPPGASPSCRQLSDECMDVAAGEAEAINRQTLRSKGGANRARNRPGRPAWADRPRPVLAWFGPVSLPDASRSVVDLLPYACGPLTSSSPWFRQSSLSCKLQHLLSRSLEFSGFMLRSLGPLESCSWGVLTCVGLHDLLLKCLMNLSRKSPL
jgi:hypothetical protein